MKGVGAVVSAAEKRLEQWYHSDVEFAPPGYRPTCLRVA